MLCTLLGGANNDGRQQIQLQDESVSIWIISCTDVTRAAHTHSRNRIDVTASFCPKFGSREKETKWRPFRRKICAVLRAKWLRVAIFLQKALSQCDQIGRFQKFLWHEICNKSSPKLWATFWSYFEKPHSYVKTAVAANGATFGNIWATFYSNI